MYICEVKIHNYGIFKEMHISLKDKSIIYGETGSGKTTLLSSIYWCPFGTPLYNNYNQISIDTCVEVVLDIKDIKYVFKRYVKDEKKSSIYEPTLDENNEANGKLLKSLRKSFEYNNLFFHNIKHVMKEANLVLSKVSDNTKIVERINNLFRLLVVGKCSTHVLYDDFLSISDETEMSSSEETIIKYAIIDTLILIFSKCCNENIPLIFDCPFGRLDLPVLYNLSKYLIANKEFLIVEPKRDIEYLQDDGIICDDSLFVKELSPER